MSRPALARTYRPRRFSEVATQEHVSATLRSAVERGRVAHAYLFSGPRGVGKTTLARVLAMALNCPQRTAEGEPCGSCDSCQRIWAGKTSLDVVEIDAASNRGVDDARDLRERAMYAPSEEGRYKVYIIDEAHMLTREAWNALLKILEEPPSRVIFVFATTEPQKIQQAAPPILSRCQRFDFHRIGTLDLLGRMRQVLASEGIEATDEVLLPIAQKADGGMRDALSLLDQVLSFTEGTPDASDVARVLGLVSDELYLELMDIVSERRHGDVFRYVGHLLEAGHDLAEFYRGLGDFLRNLLMIRLGETEQLELRADLREAYVQRAERFAPADLLRMLAQVAELDADGRFRKSGQQRILIELLLLRFTFMEGTVALEEVVRALGGGGSNPGGGGTPTPWGGPSAAADPPPAAPPPPTAPAGEPGAQAPANTPTAAASRPDLPAATREPGTVAAPPSPPPSEAPAESQRSVMPPPIAPAPADVPTRAAERATSTSAAPDAPIAGATSAAGAAAASPPATDAAKRPASLPLDLPDVRAAWRGVLEAGDGVPTGMGLILRPARLSVTGPGAIQVGVPPGSPVLERLSRPVARRPMEEALAKRLGRPVSLEFVASAEAGAPSGGGRITAEAAREERLKRLVEEEPVLEAAVQEWDLELLD